MCVCVRLAGVELVLFVIFVLQGQVLFLWVLRVDCRHLRSSCKFQGRIGDVCVGGVCVGCVSVCRVCQCVVCVCVCV